MNATVSLRLTRAFDLASQADFPGYSLHYAYQIKYLFQVVIIPAAANDLTLPDRLRQTFARGLSSG